MLPQPRDWNPTNGRFALAVLLSVVLTAGCTRDLAPEKAATVAADAARLLDEHPSPGDVESSRWPSSIAGLRPERVYVRNEGLYICQWTFFATERGYFVPRPDIPFKATPNTDPSYRPMAAGVFKYRLAG